VLQGDCREWSMVLLSQAMGNLCERLVQAEAKESVSIVFF